jgi:general secretion pathway protein A
MYENFYGLRERPFDLVPNPRFLFLTARQRAALANLKYGLTAPRGLTVLIGEAGTGKTTLLQTVISGLNHDRIECILLSNPTLARPEFYEFLAIGFGLGSAAITSKTRFLFQLRRHLLARQAEGLLSALVLDEAQSLPYELLEEVRLLSNIETSSAKLLNVVLAGQPELATRLNEPSLRQLKQRIASRCALTPLNLSETAAYIAGRLRIAGGDPSSIFTREAIQAIFQGSQGVPRTINVICDNALLSGFASETKPVTRLIVDEVHSDFDIAPPVDETARHEEFSVAPTGFESIDLPTPSNGGKPSEISSALPPSPEPDVAGIEEPQLFSKLAVRRRRFLFF